MDHIVGLFYYEWRLRQRSKLADHRVSLYAALQAQLDFNLRGIIVRFSSRAEDALLGEAPSRQMKYATQVLLRYTDE